MIYSLIAWDKFVFLPVGQTTVSSRRHCYAMKTPLIEIEYAYLGLNFGRAQDKRKICLNGI